MSTSSPISTEPCRELLCSEAGERSLKLFKQVPALNESRMVVVEGFSSAGPNDMEDFEPEGESSSTDMSIDSVSVESSILNKSVHKLDGDLEVNIAKGRC